jgi:hypothetical protein
MTRTLIAVLGALALVVSASAQDSSEGPDQGFETHPEAGKQPAWTLGSGRTLWLFPVGDVYPVYIADPHRPMTAVMPQFYSRVGIYDSTDVRTGLAVGGRFGILRLTPVSPGGRTWQLSVDAGLNAQFDSNQKLDNVGWDGKYGLTLTTANGGPLSLRVAIFHDSAHIGDEYAERTGRTRIDYTREEFAFGFAVRPARGWRFYAEGAYAHFLLTEEQRPWRAQGGLEYTRRPSLLGGRFAWYAAVDFSGTEERDWRLDTSVQTGITTTSGGRRWRLGVQYNDGAPPMGEFFQDTEAWFTLGIWIDM